MQLSHSPRICHAPRTNLNTAILPTEGEFTSFNFVMDVLTASLLWLGCNAIETSAWELDSRDNAGFLEDLLSKVLITTTYPRFVFMSTSVISQW